MKKFLFFWLTFSVNGILWAKEYPWDHREEPKDCTKKIEEMKAHLTEAQQHLDEFKELLLDIENQAKVRSYSEHLE